VVGFVLELKNPERIRQGARQSAEKILANQATQQAANEERWARLNVEHQARLTAFEQQRPQLEILARQEHQARFQPLEEILDQLAEPVRAIRDEYFPGSPVFVADHYEDSYSDGAKRYHDNTYYRALMVLDRNALPGTTQRLLGVYAIAQEPARKKFVMFGPYQDTRYDVGVGLHYIHTDMLNARDRDYWGRFLQGATGVRGDLEHTTPETDLFDIVQGNKGGTISFASHYGTAPSFRDIKHDIGQPIRFRPQNPRTFSAIEARFANVLSSRELEILRVTRGNPTV